MLISDATTAMPPDMAPPVVALPPPPPDVAPPTAPPVAASPAEASATSTSTNDAIPSQPAPQRGFLAGHVDKWLAFECSFIFHVALMVVLASWIAREEKSPPLALAVVAAELFEPPIEQSWDTLAEFQAPEALASAEFDSPNNDLYDAIDPNAAYGPLETEQSDVVERLDADGLLAKVAQQHGELARLNRGGYGAGEAGAGDAYDRRLYQVRAQTGDVQVSLFWNNYNDLDLHVTCPSGEKILFSHARSACGGRLDVDMNVRPLHSRTPVENIFWAKGKAPTGRYIVAVDHYHNHGQRDPTEFMVRVKVDGKSQDFRGKITRGQPAVVMHEFTR